LDLLCCGFWKRKGQPKNRLTSKWRVEAYQETPATVLMKKNSKKMKFFHFFCPKHPL
jgi:hypothetical protein